MSKLTSQGGPLFSPQIYRKFVKPYQAEYIAFSKERTEVKVFYHSCGDVYPLINDLIGMGVEALNPVQVSTNGLKNTVKLKQEFGDKISFWGGIDTQKVMPRGSPEDVRIQVKKRIEDLASGGGYIVAAVHNIQPDVPLENIWAMMKAAREFGSY